MAAIFASTACVATSKSLTDHVQDYLDAGIQDIELGAGPSVSESDLKFVEGVTEASFLVHNYFPPPDESFVVNLASPSVRVRQQSLDQIARSLEFCTRIGAAFYSTHAGFITDPSGFNGTSFDFPKPDDPGEILRGLERFVDGIRKALVLAEPFGVDLLVENNVCSRELAGIMLLSRPSEFVQFLEMISAPRLGILMDTGHLNVSATALGFDRLDFAHTLGSHIKAVHLHDNDGLSDKHRPAVEGSWAIDAVRGLSNPTVIVEAKFATAAELASYMESLRLMLGSAS